MERAVLLTEQRGGTDQKGYASVVASSSSREVMDTAVASEGRNEGRNRALLGASIAAALLLFLAITVGGLAYKHPSSLAASEENNLREGVKAVFRCKEDTASKTLQLVEEAKMDALFGGRAKKYEASDVFYRNGYYYVICDSSWSIWRVDQKALSQGADDGNDEIIPVHEEGDLHKEDEDSGYEAIWYDHHDSVFYVVRESLPHEGRWDFHASIEAISLSGPGEEGPSTNDPSVKNTLNAELVEACRTEDIFEGSSKGLCEGNHCMEGFEGKDEGNGVILIMKKGVSSVDEACVWRTVRRMRVPASASFTDYSAIAYNGKTRMMAITSQEDSTLWVGRILQRGDHHTPRFDPDTSYLEDGTVYHFPRSNKCNIVYCNIEGVDWIDDHTVVVVSDRMKSRGKQDRRCGKRDQSVHVFTLPPP